MTRKNIQSIIDDMYNEALGFSTIVIYTRFNALRLEKDASGKFPAFTLSDSMLTLEYPGGIHYFSIDGIDLITGNY